MHVPMFMLTELNIGEDFYQQNIAAFVYYVLLVHTQCRIKDFSGIS